MRPIRIVLRWQLIATAALTLAAVLPWGAEGAVSAALGGLVNVAAGWAYGWRVSRGEARTAGEALATMFREWAVKLVLVVALLWLVMKLYRDLVPAAFFVAFVVTLGVFAAAIAVGEAPEDKKPRPAGDQ